MVLLEGVLLFHTWMLSSNRNNSAGRHYAQKQIAQRPLSIMFFNYYNVLIHIQQCCMEKKPQSTQVLNANH